MEAIKKKERFFGLDIYRILCCIGVLVYHVADDTFVWGGVKIFTKSKLLYFLASYCVPGFFLMAGYLFYKNSNSLEKIEQKILSVMGKLFGWIVFWIFVYYFYDGVLHNVFEQFEQAFVSGGIMPVGWFLFTYCFILIIAYPVKKGFLKFEFLFSAISICLLICLAIFRKHLFRYTQSLWLDIYFTYFLVGMTISFFDERIAFFKTKLAFAFAMIFLVASTIFYIYKFKNTPLFPHTFYGKWYYSIYLLSEFFVCKNIKVNNEKAKNIIGIFSKNTMTVYMFHLPFLLFITRSYKIVGAKDVVFVVFILFFVSQLIALIFRRLPLLNKLI